jgi:hypothetical protein
MLSSMVIPLAPVRAYVRHWMVRMDTGIASYGYGILVS